MNTTFKMATATTTQGLNLIGKASKVEEDLFWQTLEDKLKKVTANMPEKYEETLDNVKNHLSIGTERNVTIDGTWFEIKRTKS